MRTFCFSQTSYHSFWCEKQLQNLWQYYYGHILWDNYSVGSKGLVRVEPSIISMYCYRSLCYLYFIREQPSYELSHLSANICFIIVFSITNSDPEVIHQQHHSLLEHVIKCLFVENETSVMVDLKICISATHLFINMGLGITHM